LKAHFVFKGLHPSEPRRPRVEAKTLATGENVARRVHGHVLDGGLHIALGSTSAPVILLAWMGPSCFSENIALALGDAVAA